MFWFWLILKIRSFHLRPNAMVKETILAMNINQEVKYFSMAVQLIILLLCAKSLNRLITTLRPLSTVQKCTELCESLQPAVTFNQFIFVRHKSYNHYLLYNYLSSSYFIIPGYFYNPNWYFIKTFPECIIKQTKVKHNEVTLRKKNLEL